MRRAVAFGLGLGLVALLAAACEEPLGATSMGPAPGKLDILAKAPEGGDTGWWPQVRFDAKDRPHVAFCDAWRGDLRYATRDGGAWKLEDVATAGAVGKYVALALDPAGRPGVSFYDQTNELLLFGWRDEKSWHVETLARGKELGVSGELRFGADGIAELFHYDPHGKLLHARRKVPLGAPLPPGEQDAWTSEEVGAAVAGFSAKIGAALRPDGAWFTWATPVKADTVAMLGHIQGGAITVTPLELGRGAGWRTWLGFVGPEPYIVLWLPQPRQLAIARRGADGWKTRGVIDNVTNFAATQGPTGEPVVVCQEQAMREFSGGRLALLRERGGQWQRTELPAQPPAGDHLAVGVDSRGRALVLFHSSSRKHLELYDETGTP
jgi:hypothetical protein